MKERSMYSPFEYYCPDAEKQGQKCLHEANRKFRANIKEI